MHAHFLLHQAQPARRQLLRAICGHAVAAGARSTAPGLRPGPPLTPPLLARPPLRRIVLPSSGTPAELDAQALRTFWSEYHANRLVVAEGSPLDQRQLGAALGALLQLQDVQAQLIISYSRGAAGPGPDEQLQARGAEGEGRWRWRAVDRQARVGGGTCALTCVWLTAQMAACPSAARSPPPLPLSLPNHHTHTHTHTRAHRLWCWSCARGELSSRACPAASTTVSWLVGWLR